MCSTATRSSSSRTTQPPPRSPGPTPATEGLIVETDPWKYHTTRRAFEDDRARDALTTRAGYRTLRFTDRQLTTAPHSVAAAVRSTLAAAAPRR
jgi:very-short-patch-repair endonuclease